MSTFLDEGRAPVVIDVDYHAPTGKRIPVDVAGFTVSGINLGAVEIKNSADNTEAFVGHPTDDFDEHGLATVAHNMAYDGSGGDNWERVRAVYTDVDDVGEDSINPALAVGAVILGLDESDQFDRIRGTEEYGLEVDITRMPLMPITISGDIQIGAVEIKDASSDTRATVTSDYGLEVDVTRVQGTTAISGVISEILAPFVVSGDVTLLGTTAISGITSDHIYVFDNVGTHDWTKAKAIQTYLDNLNLSDYSPTLFTGTLIYGYNDNYYGLDRIRGSANNGLEADVTRVQGTTAVSGILNAGVIINRLAIDISSNVNILITGIPDNKIKVLSCLFLASGAANIAFRSDTASGVRLTGELVLDASGAGFVLDSPATREMHHFETNTGEALVLTVDPATYVGGYLNYYVDP